MMASVSGRNFRVFCATLFRSCGLLLLIAFQSFTSAGIYHIRAGHRHSPIAVRRRRLYRETGFETARFSFWPVPLYPLA
jgi:hypothetical protein